MGRIFLSPPDVGEQERALLLDAFDSNWIAPLGPHVDAFELEFAARVNAPHAVALSSGTAGLHLALLALGVGRGDRVYVSTLTFAATANAVTYVGAEPVFIDCDRLSWNLDPDLVAEALERDAARGKLPRALIAVDLYGQCADYDRLRAVCARFDVRIIQDAAEALGATYRGQPSGGQGDIGVFSFNGNKIITTSGGGMMVSGNKAWVDQSRNLATQAREPVAHYEHTRIGFNYRLSNLLAAVGRGQLRSLDAKVARRRAHFEAYVEAFASVPGFAFMPEAPYGTATRWLTCLTVDPVACGADRSAIIAHLAAADVEARPVWKPMHAQPVFRGCEAVGGAVAEDLFARGLCLPSGSSLSDEDRGRVIGLVRSTPGLAS